MHIILLIIWYCLVIFIILPRYMLLSWLVVITAAIWPHSSRRALGGQRCRFATYCGSLPYFGISSHHGLYRCGGVKRSRVTSRQIFDTSGIHVWFIRYLCKIAQMLLLDMPSTRVTINSLCETKIVGSKVAKFMCDSGVLTFQNKISLYGDKSSIGRRLRYYQECKEMENRQLKVIMDRTRIFIPLSVTQQ